MLRQTITRLISSSEAGLLPQGPKILEEITSRNTLSASIAARAQAFFSTSTSAAAAAGVGASEET
jgi:ABC-type transporter Mla subunit MlaD